MARPPGAGKRGTVSRAGDPEVLERAREYMRAGLTQRLLAKAIGVHETTLSDWLALGRKGVEPYAAFLGAVDSASAEHARELLDVVTVAAKGDKNWRAAAWLLEHRYKLGESADLAPTATEANPQKGDGVTAAPVEVGSASDLETEIAELKAIREEARREGKFRDVATLTVQLAKMTKLRDEQRMDELDGADDATLVESIIGNLRELDPEVRRKVQAALTEANREDGGQQ